MYLDGKKAALFLYRMVIVYYLTRKLRVFIAISLVCPYLYMSIVSGTSTLNAGRRAHTNLHRQGIYLGTAVGQLKQIQHEVRCSDILNSLRSNPVKRRELGPFPHLPSSNWQLCDDSSTTTPSLLQPIHLSHLPYRHNERLPCRSRRPPGFQRPPYGPAPWIR
jgi:hypothetical protein